MYTDCLNHLLTINFSFADASWLVDYINCVSNGGYDYVYNENTYSWDCIANPRFFRMSVKRESTFAPVPDDMPCPDTVVFGILAPGSDCERNYMGHSNYKEWLFNNDKSAVYYDLMAYINGNDNSCDVSKHAVADSAISYMIANNNSQQSQSFVQQCIAQMIQNPGIFTSITPFIIEKNIDDSQLDPCTKGILDAIKNSHNNDVATIIAKLGNPNSVYSLKIVPKYLGPNYIGGNTNWTGFTNNGTTDTPFNYTIELNSNVINEGTTLQIYADTLHEIIHAYFLSLVDDCRITHGNGCNAIRNLPYLWQCYVSWYNGNITNPTSNISQHNQFATNYVTIIAAALEEYQPGLPQQYYNDLAWGGLAGTVPYNLLSESDRRRIEKNCEAEAFNMPTEEYTPSGTYVATHIPKGTPCSN